MFILAEQSNMSYIPLLIKQQNERAADVGYVILLQRSLTQTTYFIFKKNLLNLLISIIT